MVAANVANEINMLQPDEQSVLLSLLKSMKRRNERRTEAQIQFAAECKKYEHVNMSMDEINEILNEDLNCKL